jgi:subtilisin-like proprotein convertase family protein
MRTLFLLLASIGNASAAVITVTDSATTAIPDGNSAGVVRSLAVNAPGEIIISAEVDLNISGASAEASWLGDLYIYLSNGTDLSVLTNRAGRRAGATAGYGDNQPVTVTFSTAGAADFHNYRLAVTGSHDTALTGPLTGTWQADGRAVDPLAVLDTSPRTAGLDIFNGDAATGTWRLFAADMSGGMPHEINGWTLRLTTIPEPGSAVLLLTALAAAARRRR